MISKEGTTWLYEYIEAMLRSTPTNDIRLRLTRAQAEYLMDAIEVAGHPDDE